MKPYGCCRLFRSAVLFALLPALVFSCKPKSEAAGPAESAPSGPVTLSFWHSMTDEAGIAFESYIREFNEGPGAEKQITVEAVFQGQYADATAKLRPLLQVNQTDALPDVMQLDATGIVDYLNTEYAYTVDDALLSDKNFDLAQIMEAPLKAWNYGGRQLGLPLSASTTVMYYNKTLLDAAGVSAPPSCFEEIIEAARKLPALNGNGQELTAFAQIPNTPYLANWIGQIPGGGRQSSYVVDNSNGRDGNAAKLVCDSEGTLLSFLEGWKSLYDAGALLNVAEGINNLFLTEQICFMAASTSQLAGLLAQIDGRFELGCAYFPRINRDVKFGAAVSGSGVFMFNKGDAAKTAAAWEFVKFMCGADVQSRLSVATGYMPVNTNALKEKAYTDYIAQYPQAELGARQVSETSADMLGVIVGPSRNFYMEIMNQVSLMLTENKTPAETVTAMASALNLLLEDYAAANAE